MVEKKIVEDSAIERNLNQLLEHRTAGNPDDAAIRFTDLSPHQLAQRLQHLGTPVSHATVRRWMDEKKLRLRRIQKVLSCGHSAHRNQQFERIAELIEQYRAAGNPYFSVDTKARELLGQLYRQGRVRCTQPFQAFDHDFPTLATGVVIPHGIYDPVHNCGHLNLGVSRDTTQFACDSLAWFWQQIGQPRYPNARSILILCDGGGSNSARKYIFKYDLQRLANRIGLEIRIAHYPSYCSKYNPIERRFFPHVGRACAGRLFDSLDTVVALMQKATTSKGLKTTVKVIHQKYLAGREATEEIKRNLEIVYDELLPQWNYRAIPQNPTLVV
ncbi:MAG: ISAzo13 family transposase [Cyanobacteria bacterium J06597_1]